MRLPRGPTGQPQGLPLQSRPIQPPVLYGFGQVRGTNLVCGRQIGDGPADLEDSGVGPGAEAEFVDGVSNSRAPSGSTEQ